MVRLKTAEEYINVHTAINIDRETDGNLKATTEALDISKSVFIRNAIKKAIVEAGVVKS